MYVPAHFAELRTGVLRDWITQYPFGTLVTSGKRGLDANHLPFELHGGDDEQWVLRGHVARSNPVWQDVVDGAEVLVVFHAGDAYISPNSYVSKHETHRLVPTWNYRVVHAYGNIAIRDDVRFVSGVVGRLTKAHEADQPMPWKMSDAPKEFMQSMLQAIVGIEITVTRMVGKAKLSQNRESRDVRSAGEALKTQGDDALAEAMLANVLVGD